MTALLIARASMPDIEVTAALNAMLNEINFVAAGSTAGALISRHRATNGLSIPLHPAAETFLT